MVVIPACREKGETVPHLLREVEAQCVTVKRDGSRQVRDLEVDVANARLGVDRGLSRCRSRQIGRRSHWRSPARTLAANRFAHRNRGEILLDLAPPGFEPGGKLQCAS